MSYSLSTDSDQQVEAERQSSIARDNHNRAARAERVKLSLKSLSKNEFKKLMSMNFFRPKKA